MEDDSDTFDFHPSSKRRVSTSIETKKSTNSKRLRRTPSIKSQKDHDHREKIKARIGPVGRRYLQPQEELSRNGNCIRRQKLAKDLGKLTKIWKIDEPCRLVVGNDASFTISQ